MKKSRRFFIALLCIALLICSTPSIALTDDKLSHESSVDEKPTWEDVVAEIADSRDTYGPLDESTVPEAVGCETAYERGHVKRLYEEEPDLNTVIFLNADETQTLYLFNYPVKYIDESGKVRDIKLTVQEDAASFGDFTSGQNKTQTRFSSKLTDGIQLTDGDVSVQMIPMATRSTMNLYQAQKMPKSVLSTSKAEKLDEKTVSYAYDEKTTLEYTPTYAGFKEDIVVQSYTGQTAYDFTLLTNGLVPVEQYGSYYLADGDGEIRANIGDIIIFTADECNNTMGWLSFRTVEEKQEYVMTVHVDADWLRNENTAYPIRIDPTIEINSGTGAIEDVTINSLQGSSGSSGSLFVGCRETYGISHALMKFPTLDLTNIISEDHILSATVQLRDLLTEAESMAVYCCLFSGNEWTESTANWSNTNPNSFNGALSIQTVSHANGKNLDPVHRYSFDITWAVKSWKAGRNSQNKGIIFRTDPMSESDELMLHKTFASYNRSQYQPSLTMTYNSTGESIDEAESITLDSSQTVSQQRYYKFKPPTDGFYTIESSNNTGDPKVWLYNSLKQELESSDDEAGNRNFRLTYQLLSSQTYYISAGFYGTGKGSYQFQIKHSTSSTLPNAYTLSFSSLSAITLDKLTVKDKRQYFKFIPTETAEYVFYSSSQTSGDPKIWIYSSSLSYINQNDDSAGNSNFKLTVSLTAGQTYYLAAGHFGQNTGNYSVRILKSATLSTGVYYFQNVGSSRYMDIDGPGKQQQVHQWDRHDGFQERWKIEKQSDGYYTIRSEYGQKKYVGAENTNIGVDNINLYTEPSVNTRWNIYTNSIGELFLESRTALGKVIYAPNNNNNTELQLDYLGNNNTRSKWKAEQFKKDAIILLPGIMGSQIFAGQDITIVGIVNDNIFSKDDKLWDPKADLEADERTRALVMNTDGTSKYITYINPPTINSRNKSDNGFRYGAQDMYRGSYNRLYDEFYKEKTCDVVFFEYDWREHPYDTALKLNQFINEQDYGSVTFVSHSMGGLVSSFYLSLGSAQRNKTKKHISIGTPYLGAAKMIDVYATGDALSPVENFFIRESIKKVVPNMPSIYALLPYEQYWQPCVWRGHFYANDGFLYPQAEIESYDSSMQFLRQYLNNWNSSLMSYAINRNKQLFGSNGTHITQMVDSYYIVGENLTTVGAVVFDPQTIPITESVIPTMGDGTVSVQSATISNSIPVERTYSYTLSHTDMVSDESCLSQIVAIIGGVS